MKFKKIFSIVFASILLFSISQSVMGATTPNTLSPNVIGVGDTRDNAISLLPDQTYDLFLSTATDQDWFYWKNTTGQSQYIRASLTAKGQQNVLSLGTQIIYSNGRDTTMLYADPTYPNTSLPAIIRNLEVPDGATIYFKVNASQFFALEQYSVDFLLYKQN